MRLTDFQKQSIIDISKLVFGENSKIYLFGSRVDDSRRGGDIDLFIECLKEYNNFSNEIEFFARLTRKIGEQKIDIIIKTIDEVDNRYIVREAQENGILL